MRFTILIFNVRHRYTFKIILITKESIKKFENLSFSIGIHLVEESNVS